MNRSTQDRRLVSCKSYTVINQRHRSRPNRKSARTHTVKMFCAFAAISSALLPGPAQASPSLAIGQQAPTGNISVVMFGDSITQGWSQQVPTFFEGKPYVNKGISGNTTGQMLQRFNADVLGPAPRVVVILGGINDLASGTDAKTVASIEANMASMIDQAKKKNIRVIVASILPVGYEPEGMQVFVAKRSIVNSTIRQINARFKKLAVSRKVVYLNYYRALTNESGELLRKYNADNVHITADAYAVMGPLVEQAIATASR
jgi:lysophospholipase L1-like esterase